MKNKLLPWSIPFWVLLFALAPAKAQEFHKRGSVPHENYRKTTPISEKNLVEEHVNRSKTSSTPVPKFSSSSSTADRIAGNILQNEKVKRTNKPALPPVSEKYKTLKQPKRIGEGLDATAMQKKQMIAANREYHQGQIKSDQSKTVLSPAVQAKKGVKANMTQAEVDHIIPKAKGGTNSYSNLQVLSKAENLKKGIKTQ
jgi:5-methylcytosine-specific restriction endonuclease McrA